MESDDPKKKGSHTTYRPSRLRDSRHEAIPSPQKKASAKAVNSQDTYFQEDVIDLANSEGEGENESENGGGVIPPNIRVAMKNQLFKRSNAKGLTFEPDLLAGIIDQLFEKKDLIGLYVASLDREDSDVKSAQLMSVLPSSKPTTRDKKKEAVVNVLMDIWITVRNEKIHVPLSSIAGRRSQNSAPAVFAEYASIMAQVESFCRNKIEDHEQKLKFMKSEAISGTYIFFNPLQPLDPSG
jgi:hypothetical protein